jgi:hypothetical protein
MNRPRRFVPDLPVAVFIVEECECRFQNETGGVLVGSLTDAGGTVYIQAAVSLGPNAVHHPASFLRDGDYSQVELD